MNIKEKFKNSLLYKFINGGTVEEQDIDTMTVSPDDAATLMALRSAEKETEASIAEYKSGVGFVVSPEIAKTGRANPEKISYLYTSEDINISIKEVRPMICSFINSLNNPIVLICSGFD